MIQSRYTFIFKRNGHNFIYNSRRNSFYEIDDDTLSFLNEYLNGSEQSVDPDEEKFVNELCEKKILVSETEDDEYLQELEVKHRIRSFKNDFLNMTLVPTVSCNLRCPYCFETEKPTGVFSKEVVQRIIEFVEQYPASNYGITWFGGEPLLGGGVVKTVLDGLNGLEGKKLSHHSMVTNGTLLSDEILELFKKYPLDDIQITLDGDRYTHDRKRFTQDGRGTFDIILKNAAKFRQVCTSTHMTFRVNIDNKNSLEYEQVADKIRAAIGSDNVCVYPGILRANKGCESDTFFSTKDHIEFFKRLYDKKGEKGLYPDIAMKGCCATCISSFVIGPKGELYCCWEHVGKKDKVVGSIMNEDDVDTQLNNKFLLHGNCFADEECRKCGLLPICSGGCPNKRIENKYYGANHNLCSIYKGESEDVLNEVLYLYYLKTQEV